MRLRLKTLIGVSIILLTLLVTASASSFAETITYTYDNLNRLVRVNYGSGTTITYLYDAAGNRINMASSLWACYAFNEGTGNIAHDSSGNGHNGIINSATWTTGKEGGRIEL